MAPIHDAARLNDVLALRRELDAGVSPDLLKLDPDPERNGWLEQSPYLRKVYETPGGFKAYEKAHRQRLTAIFLSKSKFQSLRPRSSRTSSRSVSIVGATKGNRASYTRGQGSATTC